MARESSKTRALRGSLFEDIYLRGRVIDIGCGDDLICGHAEPFDRDQGDASRIAELRSHEAYDAVCSSHCLEHMADVRGALRQWWMLVKCGGFLIVVVPDEDLYEQGGWPSLFNADHKATFRFRKPNSWSPVSLDLEELASLLPGAEIVSYERQDSGYDYRVQRSGISLYNRLLFRASRYWEAACGNLGLSGGWLQKRISRLMVACGAPVDQTAGNALAQIQIIVRKVGDASD